MARTKSFYHSILLIINLLMITSCIVMILQLAVLCVNDPLIDETYVSDPPDQVFNVLRMVKINSFRGYPNEIRLLKILLEKAVALELLILVAPAWDINETASTGMPVSASLEQLLLFPRTSSEARILFYEYGEETRNWPQHIPKSQYVPH